MDELTKTHRFSKIAALCVTCASVLTGCGGADSVEWPADEAAITDQSDVLAATPGDGVVAKGLLGRQDLIHGLAADGDLVFVTEPLGGRVAVHDRRTGEEVAQLPPPPGGWRLPFAMRVAGEGHLVVLDAGGFPNPAAPGIPRVFDYQYQFHPGGHQFSAQLTRSVSFASIPLGFSEDIEVLDDGSYVVSDVVFGALWLVLPDGSIVPGIVPEAFDRLLPGLAACFTGQPLVIDGIPFDGGGFAPGVGSMADSGGYLYYGNSCLGGVHRIPVASLSDPARPPHERAGDAEVVSPAAPGVYEVIKGLAFHGGDPRLYALDTFRLRLVRIDVTTGSREVLIEDPLLLDFPVSSTFLPGPGVPTLLVASDQEHRFAGINLAIPASIFQLPFLVTRVLVTD